MLRIESAVIWSLFKHCEVQRDDDPATIGAYAGSRWRGRTRTDAGCFYTGRVP
jgi:hypothetical protein